MEAARDGVREIPIREYTWGFGPRVVSVSPGERVRFVVRSEDIAHGFAINELGINLQLLAGTEVRSPVMTVDLPEGRYPVHCSVFCGMGHPSMKATLVVGTPRRAASQGLPWAASLASLAAVVGFAVFAKGGGGPSP